MTGIAVSAAIAVVLRLAVSWASADAGVFADMAQYHERAQHLAATGALWPDALRGPGYPALLALAYRVFGDSLWVARVVNALVGGGLAALTGVLARAAGAGPRAWVAAAIVAAYPGLVLSSVYLMPEGFYALLIVACLIAVRHQSAVYAGLAGAIAGVAMLTRSVGLALWAAPLALWLPRAIAGIPPWPTSLGRIGLFAGACVLVLAPWLVFTTRVAGGPLLDATSGFNLLAGNNPRATGRLELADEPWLRETYIAGAASVADGNARAIAAGLTWARQNPRAWGRLALVKLGYLFGLEGREHAWVYGHAFFGARSAATVTLWGLLLLVSFPLLVITAALGVLGVDRRVPVVAPLLAVIAATAVLHVASFGESRFHLPLVPLLAVLASVGAASTRPAGTRYLAVIVVGLMVAGLAGAWVMQLPELATSLLQLRAPGGWSSVPRY